ncbi:LOW QUALITY PROTEIN: hypothetical protein ACHAWT_003073 [Skeletonema menzelii]
MKSISFSTLYCMASITATFANEIECTTPSKFTGSSPKSTIYVIMHLQTGDFFTQLMDGMKQQAALVGESGVNMKIMSADNNDTKQAEDILMAAQDETTVGILTVGGSIDTLCESINTVLNTSDIAVVSFDFEGGACSNRQVLTSQMDDDIARLVLDSAVSIEGDGINVGYVNDLNFAPLLKRNDVWEEFKVAHNWNQVFFVQNASEFPTQGDLQSAISNAIEGTQNVSSIYAPWDYLSVTTVSAKFIYGADINDQDIAVMRSSTWRATAGGDPMYIGGALTRMVAKAAAKELLEKEIGIPSILITQDFLLENNVTNLMQLVEALPEMALPGFVSACWIKSIGGGGEESPVTEAPNNEIAPVPTPATERPSSANMLGLLTVHVGVILIVSFLLT